MVGSMVLCDRVREHASSTVRKLQDRGYHTAMLTGAPRLICLHCQCASSCGYNVVNVDWHTGSHLRFKAKRSLPFLICPAP